MIDGSDLRDFYIHCWQNVPALVVAMKDGDAGYIRTTSAIAKIAKSLQREVMEMPEGAIFVTYQGFRPGESPKGELTIHEIAAFVRAVNPSDDAHIPFGWLMVESIPEGITDQPDTKIRYLVPHIDADPMNMPRFERVSASQLTIDIWKLTFTVAENFS